MAERKYQFERLTPIDNMDLDVYEEAIDYVFDNSDIKNVAISGAYSAGKSSVLASYKKNHSNLRFLHISLAHFKSPDQEDETEIKESVLEGKILNQLIHQIPSEKIPQTNFRVKKKVNTKSVIRLTIGAVLFLVSTIYFFCFDMWKNYLSSLPDNWFKTILTPSTHQYALMVDGVLMVALLSFVVYRLISVQKNKNIFRKLNLNGNEIEIFEESDDSYFDKYLNEVLYLFENADADVIVFEDMEKKNIPDIVIDMSEGDQELCCILDAKYSGWKDNGYKLPGNMDIYKQFFYQEQIKRIYENTVLKRTDKTEVYNFLVLPDYIGDTKDGITRYCAKIKFYYHEDREMGVIQVNLENLITAFLEEDEGEQERQRGYLKMFCARINPFLG